MKRRVLNILMLTFLVNVAIAQLHVEDVKIFFEQKYFVETKYRVDTTWTLPDSEWQNNFHGVREIEDRRDSAVGVSFSNLSIGNQYAGGNSELQYATCGPYFLFRKKNTDSTFEGAVVFFGCAYRGVFTFSSGKFTFSGISKLGENYYGEYEELTIPKEYKKFFTKHEE